MFLRARFVAAYPFRNSAVIVAERWLSLSLSPEPLPVCFCEFAIYPVSLPRDRPYWTCWCFSGALIPPNSRSRFSPKLTPSFTPKRYMVSPKVLALAGE